MRFRRAAAGLQAIGRGADGNDVARSSRRAALAAIVTVACGLAGLGAGGGSEPRADADGTLRTGTTGNNSELVKAIPIVDRKGAKRRVVMSLQPGNLGDLRDPWGNPYQYLNFDADIPGINGRIRKDHNLHPINSDFDLYSKGPDGDSRAPLTARASRDDIIFARDGSFIGPAETF